MLVDRALLYAVGQPEIFTSGARVIARLGCVFPSRVVLRQLQHRCLETRGDGLTNAAQLDFCDHLDLVRAGRGWRSRHVPRTRAGFWRPRPYLTRADAPGDQDLGS